MRTSAQRPHNRIEALRRRIEVLGSLRELVAIPQPYDVTARQWAAIQAGLSAVEAELTARVKRSAREMLRDAGSVDARRRLNAALGEVELDLSRSFILFDTYMDILTQRHTPELGRLLAGCDRLAADAIARDHPALAIIEPALVYCDRGFGASTLREGVLFPDRSPNPIPLIQIPYSRLKEKYNLTSVLHEVGHEVMVRLGLVAAMPIAMRTALQSAGSSETLASYFGLWTSEIGPDFWTFCASGIAAAGGIREILALPPAYAFKVSWTDPHPPPFIRALLTFDWCRQSWGRGIWDEWEADWRMLYPLDALPRERRALLEEAIRFVPAVGRALLRTKYRVLDNRTIPDLFDLPSLAPHTLRGRIHTRRGVRVRLDGLAPCAHLAVFRLLKETGAVNEDALDTMMTDWLLTLGGKHRSAQHPAARGAGSRRKPAPISRN